MNEAIVINALAKRFAAPVYAFLPQVRNGVGFGRKTDRTADAIAMGLWPSRGLDIHGFEVKVSRSDWKRELAKPEKSADIQRFCDRWWIAVHDDKIIGAGELPDTWGLMTLDKKGVIKVVREAPKLKAEPLDRLMMASIFRKVDEAVAAKLADCVPKAEFNARLKAEIESAAKLNAGYREQELARAQRAIDRFEAASGVKLNEWNAEGVGKALALIERHGPDVFFRILATIEADAKRLAKMAGDTLARAKELEA